MMVRLLTCEQKPSSEEVDRIFETYDRQLSFIDWFLDVMLHVRSHRRTI